MPHPLFKLIFDSEDLNQSIHVHIERNAGVSDAYSLRIGLTLKLEGVCTHFE